MKQDRIFDGLSSRFGRKIYQNNDPRGAIRLHITQDDLLTHLPQKPMRVLDAGGGMGQMSQWLAEQGHEVTLLEPSEEMIEAAKNNLKDVSTVQFIQSTIQDFHTEEKYDLIIIHAVLEWLAQPLETLQGLLQHLKPNGYLSVMFFNQTSKEMRHLLGGDLSAVLDNRIASNGHNGLAPISPLLPQTVVDWLPQAHLELVAWSGVRCFYDYSHPEVRKKMELDQVLTLERRYSQQEPWRSIARYQHMICKIIGI